MGFTGGFCIDDRWLGDAESTEVWRETQIRLTGPIVAHLQAAFAVNWKKTTDVWLEGDDYFPPLEATGSVVGKCTISGPGEGPHRIESAYLEAIGSARHRIDLANAYFIPDDSLRDALIAARSRGVRVRVIAPAINDAPFGRVAARSRFGALLAGGVELHLYHAAMICAARTGSRARSSSGAPGISSAPITSPGCSGGSHDSRAGDGVAPCVPDLGRMAVVTKIGIHIGAKADAAVRPRRPWQPGW